MLNGHSEGRHQGRAVTEIQGEVRTVPRWPSSATAAAAALALLLVAFSRDTTSMTSFRIAIVGYVLGALIVPLGVAAHRYHREEAKRSPYFDPRHRYDTVAAVSMGLGILAAAWHAFVIATELAR